MYGQSPKINLKRYTPTARRSDMLEETECIFCPRLCNSLRTQDRGDPHAQTPAIDGKPNSLDHRDDDAGDDGDDDARL